MNVFPIDLESKPRPYFAEAYNASHHGTDIFAARGANVFAVEDGQVRQADDPKGGTVAYLTTADGTKYYYAHLDEFVGKSPRPVKTGEVIGTVGNSGNAIGKATHLHFQVSLAGIGTVNPFPLLQEVGPKVPLRTSPPSGSRGATGSGSWGGLVVLGIIWLALKGRKHA
jgi:murein DD-endopeptidase MepM/ murein hydrolase activator NlpD